jgi:hypothetical protein
MQATLAIAPWTLMMAGTLMRLSRPNNRAPTRLIGKSG